jgi:hypothetical protein
MPAFSGRSSANAELTIPRAWLRGAYVPVALILSEVT